MWLAPAAFYLACLAALTWPLMRAFSTHYFAGPGDGMQNVWNLWWVNKAVTELHQSPWHTTWLHYPYGVSLLPHTLNPFNGLIGIPLQRFLSLVQTHNAIIVFAFVFGGVAAFWLCHELVGGWGPALVGGYVFTFSNYHFAHATGHMQLVSLEWIPLFLLCAYRLFDEPRAGRAIAAALALFLVILCDYYYFFYCVLAGALLVVWFAREKKDPIYFLRARHLPRLALFVALVLATAGPLVWSLWRLARTDPLLGSHDPSLFSLDALGLFIPGGHWRFASLTRRYWSSLPGNAQESSLHIGLSVIVLMVCARGRRDLRIWWALCGLFGLLALGPVLHVGGRPLSGPVLPYAWLTRLFPVLAISGCPARMVVMVTLSAALLSAAGWATLLGGSGWRRGAAFVLVGVMVVEYLPSLGPPTRLSPPPYVEQLRGAPPGGAMDLGREAGAMLFYQTIHQKPLAFGYLARLPRSVALEDETLMKLAGQGQLHILCERYGIRYVIDPAGELHDAGAACERAGR
jgi:hypothetical protein